MAVRALIRDDPSCANVQSIVVGGEPSKFQRDDSWGGSVRLSECHLALHALSDAVEEDSPSKAWGCERGSACVIRVKGGVTHLGVLS